MERNYSIAAGEDLDSDIDHDVDVNIDEERYWCVYLTDTDDDEKMRSTPKKKQVLNPPRVILICAFMFIFCTSEDPLPEEA